MAEHDQLTPQTAVEALAEEAGAALGKVERDLRAELGKLEQRLAKLEQRGRGRAR